MNGGDARANGGGGMIDPRQFRNQAGQFANDAQDLRRQLQASGAQAGELRSVDEVIRALRELGTSSSTLQNQQALATEALEKMRMVEFNLRKRLDTTSDELFLSGAEEAPARYRSQIEEYRRVPLRDGRDELGKGLRGDGRLVARCGGIAAAGRIAALAPFQ